MGGRVIRGVVRLKFSKALYHLTTSCCDEVGDHNSLAFSLGPNGLLSLLAIIGIKGRFVMSGQGV